MTVWKNIHRNRVRRFEMEPEQLSHFPHSLSLGHRPRTEKHVVQCFSNFFTPRTSDQIFFLRRTPTELFSVNFTPSTIPPRENFSAILPYPNFHRKIHIPLLLLRVHHLTCPAVNSPLGGISGILMLISIGQHRQASGMTAPEIR